MHSLRIRIGRLILVGALLGSSTAGAQDVAATLARHGIQEHTAASRTLPGWRAPTRVLLLQISQRSINADTLRAVAGGAEVIVAYDTAAAVAAAPGVDVIMGHSPEVCDRRIVNAATQLRWLASLSAGIEPCLQLAGVREKRVALTNMRGIDGPVIAEHAVALMLALAHGLDRYAVDTSRAQWGGRNDGVPTQFLEGKTLLVAGLGGIGTEVARRGHGLGMRVVATRVGDGPHPEFVEQIGQPDELLKFARTADVIVSAVPLTPQTTGMYDEQFFAALKPTAFFINVARGRSVVTDALMKALNEGRLAGAGLDVTDPEPLPANHPLWKAPRVLITPHVSTRADLPNPARGIVAVESLRRYVAGEPLLNIVDPERGF